MRSVLVAAWLLLVPAGASWAAPHPPPLFPGARKVLWVGAHPDDEALVAPVLQRVCVDEGLACTFLVLTRGENGHCLLPDGCLPDLATVRAAELARSARLFGAAVVLWRLPDGGGLSGGWDASAGGHDALRARIAAYLAQTKPDLVLTFDPRHGSTCHSDHRAAGALVRLATAAMAAPPALFFLESRVLLGPDDSIQFLPAAPAGAGAMGFDAHWQTLVDVLAVHRSQFPPGLVRSARVTPPRARSIVLAPAAAALASSAVFTCGD